MSSTAFRAWRARAAAGVVASLLALVIAAPALAQTAPPVPARPAAPAVAAPPAATVPAPQAPAPAVQPTVEWVVNFTAASLVASPDEGAEKVGTLRPLTYLEVQGYEDDWAKVYNPRTRATAYISSNVLGPADPPPAYYTAPAPEAIESIQMPARIVDGAVVSFFPTPAPEAESYRLPHNASLFIQDKVVGEDGEDWYRTSEGDYVSPANVMLPPAPPRTFAGRWIDANLSTPSVLTAYEGDRVVMTSLVIKGLAAFQTSTGVFAIQRRVANETMSSDTIGIPRNGPGGYYLQNVLFTQYFLSDGSAIHYNYWSSVWGYAGSRGCLGLPYAESEFLWNWASVGTPVSIHY